MNKKFLALQDVTTKISEKNEQIWGKIDLVKSDIANNTGDIKKEINDKVTAVKDEVTAVKDEVTAVRDEVNAKLDKFQ